MTCVPTEDILTQLRAGGCGTGCDSLAANAAEEINLLRGLLREALEMADNWPGIAYSEDMIARCKAAMPGWAPTFE
jgi:hypothetical protein